MVTIKKKQYAIPQFNHPVQSGGSYVEYVINHNLGQRDIITKMYQHRFDNPSNRLIVYDVDNSSTHTFGMAVQTTDENTCKVYLYRINSTYTVTVDGYIEQA